MSVGAVSWLHRTTGIELAGGSSSALRSQAVQINVGGTLYVVSERTLGSAAEHSDIFRRIQKRECALLNGSLFIDRDGSSFRHVINFIRCGGVLVLPDGFDDWDLLLADADYYQLPSLAEAIRSNFDYQQRAFRRQLPLNVMLRWEESGAVAGLDPASPAGHSTSSGNTVVVSSTNAAAIASAQSVAAAASVTGPNNSTASPCASVSLSPPVPGFAVEATGGALLHQGAPLPSVEAAVGVLSTAYGYRVGHWRTEASTNGLKSHIVLFSIN